MTFTEDRETFEAQLFRPPHAARMSEHAGRFVGRLDDADKEILLGDALDRLWETRCLIHKTQDILCTWIDALKFAAERRPQWRVATAFAGTCTGHEWVKSSQLGR